MKGRVCILANNDFSLKIKNGGIVSLKRTEDKKEIEFIEEKTEFGHVHLIYKEKDGAWGNFKTENLEDKSSAGVSFAKDRNTYTATYNLDAVEIRIKYILKDEGFYHKILIKNSSESNVEIGDLSIPFPMNSSFHWGSNASEKVLRHSFISGHGSYIFWERCDGTAPYLLMTPKDNTKLEYFNTFKSSFKDMEVYEAYICSSVEGKKALEKGTKWRQENTSEIILPGKSKEYSFKYQWASGYENVRELIVKEGLIDVQVVPGMTVPTDLEAMFYVKSKVQIDNIFCEYKETELTFVEAKENMKIYKVKFNTLGENYIKISFDKVKSMILEFFVTEPLEALINKRGAFIAKHQHRDSSKWYNGLLAEWSMKKKAMLGPDNYDDIKGWRIYEVTCDDPGLSKPAFLACKNSEFPVQEEVEALDYYIKNFVWGGLQRTEEEEYSYGIYGIPDWKVNRESSDEGVRGKLHIWRIYDYPHIVMMYWHMYLITKQYPSINTMLSKEEYLIRAYNTAIAMFTIPEEIIGWNAYKTGLYNEIVYEDIIKELYDLRMNIKAERLERHWAKKVKHFVLDNPDVFGSEYPYDTTGFESTYAFAEYAIKKAESVIEEKGENEKLTIDKALKFITMQKDCNIACRGWLEPAYYLLGSDYRGSGNSKYTLSYMAQMGGIGILDYAYKYCRQQEIPDMLRLGYASLLSSWALVNSGTEESNYGYWYPGKENDGAAGGGFEPEPYGTTWLGQEHHRGSWYYSCEIDLGFCGALRYSATVLTEDPIFGLFCYGGTFEKNEEGIFIWMKDGLRRRLNLIKGEKKVLLEVKGARISAEKPVFIEENLNQIIFKLDKAAGSKNCSFEIKGLDEAVYEITIGDMQRVIEVKEGGIKTSIIIEGKNDLSCKIRKI